MEQPTPLQTWIKWRLIVGAVVGPVLLIWVFVLKKDPTIPAIVAGILIATRLATDVVLFVKRRRDKQSVRSAAQTEDARSRSDSSITD